MHRGCVLGDNGSLQRLWDHSCVCQVDTGYNHRVIPIHDLIYYIEEFSLPRIGGVSDQEQQNEIHVGFNGKFYCHMVELVLFSLRPLHTAKVKNLQET